MTSSVYQCIILKFTMFWLYGYFYYFNYVAIKMTDFFLHAVLIFASDGILLLWEASHLVSV